MSTKKEQEKNKLITKLPNDFCEDCTKPQKIFYNMSENIVKNKDYA